MNGVKKYSDSEVDAARERSENGLIIAKDLAIRRMISWIKLHTKVDTLSKTEQDSLAKYANAIAKLSPQPSNNVFNITNVNRDDLISEIKRLTAIANTRITKKHRGTDDK